MIKNLRYQFCIINILTAFFVSTILFGAIYYSLYLSCENVAFNLMKTANIETSYSRQLDKDTHNKPERFLSFPIKFEGFIVTIDKNGVSTSTTDNHIDIDAIVMDIDGQTKKSMIIIDEVSYRVMKEVSGNETVVIFYDRRTELLYLTNLAFLLIGFEFIFLLIFSVFSLLISKWITRPVLESFNKQKEFIANASHEMKTPLTIISANLDLFTGMESNFCVEQDNYLNNIRTQTSQMGVLVRSLLTLARLESDTHLSKINKISISQITENIALSFETVAFENGKILNYEVEHDLSVAILREDFERLCYLLIDNAIKYCDDKGVIELKMKRVKGELSLTISNDFKSQSFDEVQNFERFHKNNNDDNSFGLGLPMCKEICNTYNIKLQVKQYDLKIMFHLRFN